MKIVTAEQIRELDRRAMTEFAIPGVVLMENAGRAVVQVMEQECGTLAGKRVAVYCGTGNNGGDGFVIARLLHLAGAQTTLFLARSPEKIAGDAAVHWKIARNLRLSTIPLPLAPSQERNTLIEQVASSSQEKSELAPSHKEANLLKAPPYEAGDGKAAQTEYDLIVDALLGTGIQDAPREPYASAIHLINSQKVPVFSVDIPSGVNADSGAVPGEAIHATHTITFAYPKIGLFLPPGTEYVGKLHIAPIGFYWDAIKFENDLLRIYAPDTSSKSLFGKRRSEANKGDFGHVLIVAGSRGMAGAPALTARAAQRIGAGLVTAITPASVQPVLAGKLDEQMTYPLPEKEGAVSGEAFDVVTRFAEKATVLCVGPGMTTASETVALIHRILTEIPKLLVLDADGLNALAQKPEMARKRAEKGFPPLVLTPHPGEAARLLGRSIPEVQADRVGAVRELAKRYQAVVVLKGYRTLTASPTGEILVNTTGNPGMATGGSGDTLTGIVGGLLAQRFAPDKYTGNHEKSGSLADNRTLETTAYGVWLHGMAGDLAASRTGEASLTAGDIILALPEVMT